MSALRRHGDEFTKLLVGSGLENRAVRGAIPMSRSFTRVVVSCERLPRARSRWGNWGHAVVADVVSFKDNATVEERCERGLAIFNCRVPKLNMAAPIIVPDGVKIK